MKLGMLCFCAATVLAQDSRLITSSEQFAKEVRDATPLTVLFHDDDDASERFRPEFEVAATMLQRLPLNRGYPLQLARVDVSAQPSLAIHLGEHQPPLPALATCFWDEPTSKATCLAAPVPAGAINVYKVKSVVGWQQLFGPTICARASPTPPCIATH